MTPAPANSPLCPQCGRGLNSEDCTEGAHWIPRLVSDVTWAIRKRMEEEKA